MEIKIETVTPNVLVHNGNHIVFSLEPREAVSVCRSIDDIIKNHIGELKVREGEFEVMRNRERKEIPLDEQYTIPLSDYLKIPRFSDADLPPYMASQEARLFNLGHLVNAQTSKTYEEINVWKRLQTDLSDPEKLFDAWEKDNLAIRLDRKATLENMQRIFAELDSKVPDNFAEFYLTKLYETPYGTNNVGRIEFEQIKAKGNSKIKQAKSELIERLKQVIGTPLSLDSPYLISQLRRFSFDAPKLIADYGDVLTNPHGWQNRLFRLDP